MVLWRLIVCIIVAVLLLPLFMRMRSLSISEIGGYYVLESSDSRHERMWDGADYQGIVLTLGHDVEEALFCIECLLSLYENIGDDAYGVTDQVLGIKYDVVKVRGGLLFECHKDGLVYYGELRKRELRYLYRKLS